VPDFTMRLERSAGRFSCIAIDPVPFQLVTMKNHSLWLWFPEETLNSYLNQMWRHELDDPALGIRKSNIYEWKYKGSPRILSDRNRYNYKWFWSLALHGLNPPYDPCERLIFRGPQKAKNR